MVLNLNKVRPIEILLLWIAKFIKLTRINLALQGSVKFQRLEMATWHKPRSFKSHAVKIYDLKLQR